MTLQYIINLAIQETLPKAMTAMVDGRGSIRADEALLRRSCEIVAVAILLHRYDEAT